MSKKSIIIFISVFIFFVLSSCGMEQKIDIGLNINNNCIDKPIRDISSSELSTIIPYGYNIITGGIIYVDINKDCKKDILLLLQDKRAKEGLGGFEQIKDVKVLYLEFKNSKWEWIKTIDLFGTMFTDYYINKLNSTPYLYLFTNIWGVSNGTKCLYIVGYKSGDFKEIKNFCVSLVNSGNILVKNNGKRIIQVDDAGIIGESRQECHKFNVKSYIYSGNSYILEFDKTTNYQYLGIIPEKISYFTSLGSDNYLFHFFSSNCIWVGGYSTNCKIPSFKEECLNQIIDYKTDLILNDVGLYESLVNLYQK